MTEIYWLFERYSGMGPERKKKKKKLKLKLKLKFRNGICKRLLSYSLK